MLRSRDDDLAAVVIVGAVLLDSRTTGTETGEGHA